MFALNRLLALTKHSLWRGCSIALILSLLCFGVALAASGSLDPTFSGDGKQTTDFANHWSDRIKGIAIQKDGKIVAVGDRFDPAHPSAITRNFALARYNANGSLDPTFGEGGKLLTDLKACWPRALLRAKQKAATDSIPLPR